MTLYLKIPKGTYVKNHFTCKAGIPCDPTPMVLIRDYVVAYHADMSQEKAVRDMARSPFETHPENVVVLTEEQYHDYIKSCEEERDG